MSPNDNINDTVFLQHKKKNVQNFKDTTHDLIMVLCFIVTITHVPSRQMYFVEIAGLE